MAGIAAGRRGTTLAVWCRTDDGTSTQPRSPDGGVSKSGPVHGQQYVCTLPAGKRVFDLLHGEVTGARDPGGHPGAQVLEFAERVNANLSGVAQRTAALMTTAPRRPWRTATAPAPATASCARLVVVLFRRDRSPVLSVAAIRLARPPSTVSLRRRCRLKA